MIGLMWIVGSLSKWFPDNSPVVSKSSKVNDYPINNNRGHAAKQKRQAKKRKNK